MKRVWVVIRDRLARRKCLKCGCMFLGGKKAPASPYRSDKWGWCSDDCQCEWEHGGSTGVVKIARGLATGKGYFGCPLLPRKTVDVSSPLNAPAT